MVWWTPGAPGTITRAGKPWSSERSSPFTFSASRLFSAEFAQVAEFAAAVAVLVYEWYIARVALAVSASRAVPVVLIDLLLGTVLGRITTALY